MESHFFLINFKNKKNELKIIKVGGGLKKMIKVNQHHKLYELLQSFQDMPNFSISFIQLKIIIIII